MLKIFYKYVSLGYFVTRLQTGLWTEIMKRTEGFMGQHTLQCSSVRACVGLRKITSPYLKHR
jgi:hypothetical protein